MKFLNKLKAKKGFTLIELIVVMAIIAILVLLAASKLLGYSDKARTTQIMNDIKVLETKIDEYLINHEAFLDTFTDGIPGAGQLYDRTGKISTAPGDLKVVDGTFYSETNLGGYFYSDKDGNVIYEDGEIGKTGNNPTEVGRDFKDEVVDLTDKDKSLQGSGTISDPYRIWYLEHFDEMDESADKMTAHYVLMRDLDFNNSESYLSANENMSTWSNSEGATTGWTPIGKEESLVFTGFLDGQDYGLFNLYINQPTNSYVSLFFKMNSETGAVIDAEPRVQNFSIYDMNIIGLEYVAGLVTSAEYSKFLDITATGTVLGTGRWSIGGIAGDGYVLDFDTIALDVDIVGDNYVGGLIGDVYVNDEDTEINIFKNITMRGSVSSKGSMGSTGGIAGFAQYIVLSETSIYASVVGTKNVGGIIGESKEFIDASNIYIYGDVVGDLYVGGILGDGSFYHDYLQSSIKNVEIHGNISSQLASVQEGEMLGYSWVSSVGGVSGYLASVNLSNIKVYGSVTSNIEYTGGIIGQEIGNVLENSMMYGNVKGGDYTGGLTGYSLYASKIINCHMYGDVDGLSFVGGAFGSAETTDVSNISAQGDVSGINDVGGIAGEIGARYGSLDVENITMSNLHFKGSVYGESNIGGVFGSTFGTSDTDRDFGIDGLSASGLVTGVNNVGGAIGLATQTNTIKNILIFSDISGTTNKGGLIGYVDSNRYVAGGRNFHYPAIVTISNSLYFNEDTNLIGEFNDSHIDSKFAVNDIFSKSTIGNGFGIELSDAELKNPATYSEWDTSIWNIVDGEHPTLRHMLN